jgi:hypothetical protein
MSRKARPVVTLPKLKGRDMSPAARLSQLLRDAEARGIKPMDEAGLEAMGAVWPEDEDLDEFLTWLRQSRREGRY